METIPFVHMINSPLARTIELGKPQSFENGVRTQGNFTVYDVEVMLQVVKHSQGFDLMVQLLGSGGSYATIAHSEMDDAPLIQRLTDSLIMSVQQVYLLQLGGKP